MASQSQPQLVPSTPSTYDLEKKRNDDAITNLVRASFGGYAADEEAEVAPSSHVKSSRKKRKKHKKEKRRQSQIDAGDDEEEPHVQVTLASSPSSRKEKRKPSTPSGDEDEDRIEVTPTPPAKRRRKSPSKKAARKGIDNDGYDATEEETEAEKKRSLVDTINHPRTQVGDDSSGTEHHAETPIRPPPRNHFSTQKHNATKVTSKRASRKAKAVQLEKNAKGSGITSDADSMRTKLSSSISDDMFSRPPARRVVFDSGLAKPMSALAIRGREAVDDEWEEMTGKVRGLVYSSGEAEAEENIAYSAQYLEASPNTTIAYGNTTRQMLMLSAGATCDVKAEKGVSFCEVTRGGPLLVVVTGGDGRGGKSFRIHEGGLWRVRAGEACHVTNVAGAEVRMNISSFGNGKHED